MFRKLQKGLLLCSMPVSEESQRTLEDAQEITTNLLLIETNLGEKLQERSKVTRSFHGGTSKPLPANTSNLYAVEVITTANARNRTLFTNSLKLFILTPICYIIRSSLYVNIHRKRPFEFPVIQNIIFESHGK